MASPLRLTLGPGSLGRAGEVAWQTVVASFEASEQAMSRFRETSELTAVNRVAGRKVAGRPSARLRRALSAADRAWRVTNGRFDPRVLADLDRLGYRGAPLSGAVDPAGGRRVVERYGRHRMSLPCPVDLGGIGKGLALRWAAAELAAGGLSEILLEAGGDVVARGAGSDGDPWLIGIEDPCGGEDLAVIAASDIAVATSSVRLNQWTVDGRTVHHLIDPRTHEPADGGLLAVTVAFVDPAWAEIWSKVLFLDGRDAIAAEARSRGLAAWWVGDDGVLEMTPAARMMTVWAAAESESAVSRVSGSSARRLSGGTL